MRTKPLDYLPSISKIQVMHEYKALERSKSPEKGSSRPPTIALRLALSVFGDSPKEGSIPLEFFAENDIQIYSGLPNHYLNKLIVFSGQTTSRKVAKTIFPNYQKRELPFEERLSPDANLSPEIRKWVEPIQNMTRRIRQEAWKPPPLNVLNFGGGKETFWLTRAEHLCGQVPDGTHRVLAYTILGYEYPKMPIPVRILHIYRTPLAVLNCLTIFIRFCMDPLRTPAFIKKRFEGSAYFMPEDRPMEKN